MESLLNQKMIPRGFHAVLSGIGAKVDGNVQYQFAVSHLVAGSLSRVV